MLSWIMNSDTLQDIKLEKSMSCVELNGVENIKP